VQFQQPKRKAEISFVAMSRQQRGAGGEILKSFQLVISALLDRLRMTKHLLVSPPASSVPSIYLRALPCCSSKEWPILAVATDGRLKLELAKFGMETLA